MKKQKLLAKALDIPKNMPFREMLTLVEAFGFTRTRVKGSHHIYTHPDIPELVNLQDVDGKAKPYQIRQFLRLVEQHDLRLGEEE